MHQLSFSAFAASRVAPPSLPVHVADLQCLQHTPSALLLRDDVAFWDVATGYVLDATRYLPTGGHESSVLSNCVYVSAHQWRVC